VPYLIPAADIVSIIDAQPTPAASLAPGRRFVALVHYESHPPVELLARPYLSLASGWTPRWRSASAPGD
jgi:hypothetical protein